MSVDAKKSAKNLSTRRLWGKIFFVLCSIAAFVGVIFLALLLISIVRDGHEFLSWEFLTRFPSRFPEKAGIKAALWGTIWLIGFTALFSIPVGVGASIYLEEYARKNWFTKTIQLNISNLAGVPSIVYGILGLAIFVRWFALGRSVIAGALTMSLLILPIIVIASQEAIKAVPGSIRMAAYAVGATRWKVVKDHVLPSALPGILTGVILAMSRALGETAPLVMIGALTYVAFTPEGPMDGFSALPIQIFNWAARPQDDFHSLAASGILVLLIVLLSMNALAIFLRNRYQQKNKW